ncbi:MAG: AMP-binding protein [Opitutaceae bacterium]|nr:AMP-binding protein [Opitutaceae bacterium]
MERLELARRLGITLQGAEPHDAIVEACDPGRFMAAWGEAVAAGGTVFIKDPAWGAVERAQFAALVQPQFANHKSQIGSGWLCLPTGGSSGQLKLIRHDQDTIAAAVRGCCGHFSVTQINAVGVLPLHHVSGLMAWMRCVFTGGRYVPWTWADMEAGRWPEIGGGDWFLSLVPTQLQRLLGRREAEERLRRFRAIFVGGGPAWPELLARAAAARLPLAPGYGMTETAAMVTALRPEEFWAGRRGCGPSLPHARVDLDADGVIRITAESLFRGYYPHLRATGQWETEDLGRFDEHGSLHVIGRRDTVIITGGKKVAPDEVEAALRATGQFADVAVIGLPDAEWGQTLVACYPAGPAQPDISLVNRHITGQLAPHKRPKRYVPIAVWPRNEPGKINRHELTALALQALAKRGLEL